MVDDVLEQVQARLAELKQEYVTGQGQLRELTQQEAALRETMLRISGAIQVLEELVSSEMRSADPKLDWTRGGDDDPRDEPPSRPQVLTVP
jgi:uncharacterized protein (DUF3084 family)